LIKDKQNSGHSSTSTAEKTCRKSPKWFEQIED
jgi:hypothetical protein